MSKLSVNIVLVQLGFWVCVCVCGLDLLCFACPMHTGRKWSNAAGGYCMGGAVHSGGLGAGK